MNRKKFYYKFQKVSDFISILSDELEESADNMSDLENNDLISSAEFQIPAHIHSSFDARKKEIYALLKWCRQECIKDKSDDGDLIEYIDCIKNELKKFEDLYDKGVDDCDTIYDLIASLNMPIVDLETIFKDDWGIKE